MRDSIASYLGEMNDTTYLPGLQREFVWSPSQIADLFDSLIRDYPVGLVITWKIRRTEREHVSYEFIRDYVAGDGPVPDEVYDAGFRRYNEPANPGRYDTLVIDGQQRLNSVLVGLTGSIARYEGGRGRARSDVANWEKQVLCVDLFGHPDYDEPSLPGDYGFAFRRAEGFGKDDQFGHETDEDGTRHFWYPLPELVDEGGRIGSIRRLRREVRGAVEEAVPEGDPLADELRDVAVGVVNDVVDEVLEHPLPSHEVEHETEHVREIFQRINTQGSDPRPYQLLLSSLMSYWPYLEADRALNPRAKVEEWVERLQREYPAYGNRIDRQLFMRYSCYLLGTDLGGTRRVSEFGHAEFDRLHALWTEDGAGFDRFVGSLETAFDVLTDVGLSETTMDSRSHVALLAKFFYESGADPDAANRNAVLRFFARLLLLRDSHGTLRRTSARRLLDTLEAADETPAVFPADRLFESLSVQPAPDDIRRGVRDSRHGPNAAADTFDDAGVAAVLGLLEGTYETADAGTMHVDRIYPRSSASAVVPDGRSTDAVDRIGNLQLLTGSARAEKGETHPAEWLSSLDDDERTELERANQYPDVAPEPDAFEAFVEAREARIVDHLVDRLVMTDGE